MTSFGRNNTKQWARLALKLGLLLTDAKLWASINDRVRDHAGDVGDFVNEKYSVAADRLDDARRSLRGETDWVAPLASFVGGIAVGVGIGILVAPVSGEEARATLRDRASGIKDEIKDKVSNIGSCYGAEATGTD